MSQNCVNYWLLLVMRHSLDGNATSTFVDVKPVDRVFQFVASLEDNAVQVLLSSV